MFIFRISRKREETTKKKERERFWRDFKTGSNSFQILANRRVLVLIQN
jgi:hypothetical protein